MIRPTRGCPTLYPLKSSVRLTSICLVVVGAALFSGSKTPLPESVMACAPCHSSNDSTQVSEWLASPYSAGLGGLVCVDCHDSRCAGTAPTSSGNPNIIASRRAALRGAAGLTMAIDRNGDTIEAEVAVTNLGVGHLFPSGAVGRSLVLEVTARNRYGSSLTLMSGPTLERPSHGDATVARKVFSGHRSTTGSLLRGSRLEPFATDVSRYRFSADDRGPVKVAARLLMVEIQGKPFEIARSFISCRDRNPVGGSR